MGRRSRLVRAVLAGRGTLLDRLPLADLGCRRDSAYGGFGGTAARGDGFDPGPFEPATDLLCPDCPNDRVRGRRYCDHWTLGLERPDEPSSPGSRTAGIHNAFRAGQAG